MRIFLSPIFISGTAQPTKYYDVDIEPSCLISEIAQALEEKYGIDKTKVHLFKTRTDATKNTNEMAANKRLWEFREEVPVGSLPPCPDVPYDVKPGAKFYSKGIESDDTLYFNLN
eukprot:TRINITY_DN1033_c0_g2_i3.p1 TRINITY_DN1033_c0_g2~~TRINITY_DN1033_c0_g2_i3.p1  ORF type:complete len:115 (+),score=24.64 TRINITY_DN1033_c0_g2_i3:80-424(+)